MKYTNEKIISRMESGEDLKFHLFWGHQEKDRITRSCLSQWYKSSFKVNGVTFKTAEHYMMAEKARLFNDQKTLNEIISAVEPSEVKKLGRAVRNYDQETWEENRFEIVVRGNFHKFSQNEQLANYLKSTKNEILVEASPVDIIWGIGLSESSEDATLPYFWNGLNLLGYALMETRDILNEIESFVPLENPVLPPWLAYPEIDFYSIGWRMGYGETHLMKLSEYLNQLSESERKIYQMTFPAFGEWKQFYDN